MATSDAASRAGLVTSCDLAPAVPPGAAAERELQELVERYRRLVELSPDGIVVHQDGLIVFANTAALYLVGLDDPEAGIGRPVTDFLHPDSIGPTIERIAALTEEAPISEPAEAALIHADGTAVAIESISVLTKWAGRTAYQVIMRDLTERKRHQEALERLALHDPLTGLPNRTLLLDRLQTALARSQRTGRRTGLVFLDLDQFKVINDSLGHSVGDCILVSVAERLTSVVRQSDTVARFGGDEFLIVCENMDRHAVTGVAVQVERALSEPFVVDDREVFITASMGIALADEGESADELLRDADTAMYEAKDHGRGRWELFDEPMRTRALERLETERGLHRAVTPDGRHSDELEVYYQPILSIDDGTLVGAEALLRWNCPGRGIVAPATFIGAAERSKLIIPIGRWVLDQTRRDFETWRADGLVPDSFAVAVNVSARQLTDSVLRTKIAQLGRVLASPDLLTVEITESAYEERHDTARAFIDSIRRLGVRVALDDFGTGFSSLARLRQYGVDTIKIDRAFVNGLTTSIDDQKIVQALLRMGELLDVAVIAEGVETREQLDALAALGCRHAQGYYIAHPLPANQFLELVAGRALAAAG